MRERQFIDESADCIWLLEDMIITSQSCSYATHRRSKQTKVPLAVRPSSSVHLRGLPSKCLTRCTASFPSSSFSLMVDEVLLPSLVADFRL